MGFKLFKSGDQLYDEGIDLINRKEYGNAKGKFNDALSKDTSKAAMARMYIALIDLNNNRGNVSSYEAFINALDACGQSQFKFGLTEIDAEAIKTECTPGIEEIRASSMVDYDYMAKGQAMIDLAAKYASMIGDAPLKLDEIAKGNTQATGTRESLILQAMAYECMGTGVVMKDPKQGSEYMQLAYNFRRQIGDSGDRDLELMKCYAKSGKCWLCGRPANGEGVHFMAVRSNISQMFRDRERDNLIKTADSGFGSIYVCMPCYSAISNRADDISRGYYNQAVSEMRAMEARLQAEIAAVRSEMLIRSR